MLIVGVQARQETPEAEYDAHVGGRGIFGGIIAGTDGSERAGAAVREGARLASMTGTRLRIVFVIDTGRPRDQGDEPLPEEAVAKATAIAEEVGATIDARIVSGDPAARLMEAADEDRTALICIGPDTGLTFGPPRIGRVASSVLRDATCSVLVSRSVEQNVPTQIVCGIDGTAGSAELADLAITIAEMADATAQLIQVVSPLGLRLGRRSREMSFRSRTFKAAVGARSERGIAPTFAKASGRAGPKLVEVANRNGSDLLIVGRRDGGMEQTLLGSVSEYCTRNASCSVLVARPSVPFQTNT